MKNTKIWRIVSAIVLAITLAAEAVTVFTIWRLDMLPLKYFAVLLAIFVLGTAAVAALMLQRTGKWEKKKGHVKQIIAYVLCAILIAVCVVASYAVSKLHNTVSNITNNTTVSALVGVYVLSDDPAVSIEDAAGYTFAVTDSYDAENSKATVTEIQELLSCEITTQNYDSSLAMIDALYAQEVDAIILSDSYIGVLDALDDYSDFSEKTKVIFEHTIEKTIVSNTSSDDSATEATVVPHDFDPTQDPFLLYISGNDARRALLADGASDVNILVAVNPKDKQILLVNTPRDYFVANPAGDGALDKLTHCGLYGIDNSVQAMSDLYGQPISYYAKINFTGFKTLVDAIGGVTIYSDISFSTTSYTYIQKGENHLNGAQALALARERRNLSGGDNDRGKNQMKIIAAMIDQLSASNLIANYADILDSLEGMFTTSMPKETISQLVKMQLSDMASWDVLSFAVTGDNGSDKPYALGGLYAYVMYPHEDEVEFASQLIGRVLNGEVLSEEDLTLN